MRGQPQPKIADKIPRVDIDMSHSATTVEINFALFPLTVPPETFSTFIRPRREKIKRPMLNQSTTIEMSRLATGKGQAAISRNPTHISPVREPMPAQCSSALRLPTSTFEVRP